MACIGSQYLGFLENPRNILDKWRKRKKKKRKKKRKINENANV